MEGTAQKQIKTLYLLRHAQASTDHGGDDKSRPLTDQGREDALALGRHIKKIYNHFDLVLCSPAKRTRETLSALQNFYDFDQTEFPEILYNGSTGDYLYEIQKISDKTHSVLFIAHNPSIHELGILLAAQGENNVQGQIREGYPPGSFTKIDIKSNTWQDLQPVENTLIEILKPIDYNAPARPTRWM